MTDPLRILVVEDREDDATLAIEALKAKGFDPDWRRVESREQMVSALDEGAWDLVLSDYSLPGFDGREALDLVRQRDREVPFILVSGTIGEEIAADAMRGGANDFVLKDKLWRLIPVIERELRDSRLRRERRAAELALRESEARYRSYFELNLIGMVTSSPDGRCLEVNDRLCEMWGYSRSELLQMTWRDVTHPADLASDLESFHRLLSGDIDRYFLDKRFIRKDGQIIRTTIAVACVRREDRSIDRVVAFVQDITERRRSEERIRESESQLAAAQRIACTGSFELDLETSHMTWSEELFRIMGLPRGEPPSQRELMRFVAKEDRIAVLECYQQSLATGLQHEVEYRIDPAHASERIFSLRIVPQRNEAGGVARMVGTVQDVTDQRRAEADLRALKRDIQLLLDSTYEGIYACDLSGRFTLVNSAAATMLGYAPGELMGMGGHAAIHGRRPDGSPYRAEGCPISRVVSDRRPVHLVSETFWRKDGTPVPVEVYASPIFDDDQSPKGVVVSFMDVTERQVLQTELERANRLAGLGLVAATMSHEFNNVLMGIQPFADALLRSSSDPRVIDAATRITQSVGRGRRVTEELRGFTRPVPPVRTPIDVRAWLTDCASEIERLMPGNLRIELDLDDTAMGIEADRDQITQVLTNVALNARDALGDAHGRIRLTAGPAPAGRGFAFGRLPSDQSFVHLRVIDDGPGIPPGALPRIFEPFFTTKKSGTGLGLAITQQIVTLHGGHLFVESELSHGTTVHIFLPETSAVQRAATTSSPRLTVRAVPREILLIEDDDSVASGLSALLECDDVKVVIAADGAEAMRVLTGYRPEALVVDIGLPDVNGFDLYERIVASFGPMPVVFSSGHADSSRLETLQSPSNACLLTKPYPFDALLSALADVCDETQKRDCEMPLPE